MLGLFAGVAEAVRRHTDARLDEWFPPADLDVDAALAEVLESGDDLEVYSDGPLAGAPAPCPGPSAASSPPSSPTTTCGRPASAPSAARSAS